MNSKKSNLMGSAERMEFASAKSLVSTQQLPHAILVDQHTDAPKKKREFELKLEF